jgi:preprotein translocase subunit SecG
MIYYLITTLHVIVCIILILVVLLQSGKGADLAGAFGGGATQTAFGSRGPASFLSKMTTGAAIVFMITSISLSTMTINRSSAKSILETTKSSNRVPAKAPTTQLPATSAPTPEQIRQKQMQIEQQQKGAAQAPADAKPATPAETPAKQEAPAPAKKQP